MKGNSHTFTLQIPGNIRRRFIMIKLVNIASFSRACPLMSFEIPQIREMTLARYTLVLFQILIFVTS